MILKEHATISSSTTKILVRNIFKRLTIFWSLIIRKQYKFWDLVTRSNFTRSKLAFFTRSKLFTKGFTRSKLLPNYCSFFHKIKNFKAYLRLLILWTYLWLPNFSQDQILWFFNTFGLVITKVFTRSKLIMRLSNCEKCCNTFELVKK